MVERVRYESVAVGEEGLTYPSIGAIPATVLRGDKITGDRYFCRDFAKREWDIDPADFKGRARDGRVALQQQKRKLGPSRGHVAFDNLLDDELTDYFHHTLFPNVTLTGTSDGLHFYRTEPDPNDPEWCTFDYWYMVPKVIGQTEVPTLYGIRPFAEAEHEQVVFGEGGSDFHLGDFLAQDLAVAVTQQQGFHSRAYTDAYLSGQESRIRRFHEVLNDYLEGRR